MSGNTFKLGRIKLSEYYLGILIVSLGTIIILILLPFSEIRLFGKRTTKYKRIENIKGS